MTRKDYVLIAEVMRESKPTEANEIQVWKDICENLAYDLYRENNRFDRNRFLTACGVED